MLHSSQWKAVDLDSMKCAWRNGSTMMTSALRELGSAGFTIWDPVVDATASNVRMSVGGA